MTFSEFISNTFLVIIDFIFSLADQVLQMLFSLKIWGISFGTVAVTIFFLSFLFYKILDD